VRLIVSDKIDNRASCKVGLILDRCEEGKSKGKVVPVL
jgi:hypothetical protein